MKNVILSADGDRKIYSVPDVVAGNLNKWVFPEEQSTLVANLGWIDFRSSLPKEYSEYPQFNF